jgi:hypothetical protein
MMSRLRQHPQRMPIVKHHGQPKSVMIVDR